MAARDSFGFLVLSSSGAWGEDCATASRPEALVGASNSLSTAFPRAAALTSSGSSSGSSPPRKHSNEGVPAAWQAVASWLPTLPDADGAAATAGRLTLTTSAPSLTPAQQAKLKALVRQHSGAPQALRPALWLLASGGLALAQQPGAADYDALVRAALSTGAATGSGKKTNDSGDNSAAEEEGSDDTAGVKDVDGAAAAGGWVPRHVVAQVQADARTVGLTWRHHALFKTGEGCGAVARLVLALLAHSRGRLVYARALTHAAAFALVVFGGPAREQQCFWALAALLRGRLFGHCGGQWQLGVRVEQEVLTRLAARKLPRLTAHLAALELPLQALTQGWLASMFVQQLPPETLACVWDALVVEGPKVQLRVALALLKAHEATLTACSSPELLRKLLDLKVTRHPLAHDPKALLAAAFRGLGSMPGSTLGALREQAMRQYHAQSGSSGGSATAAAAVLPDAKTAAAAPAADMIPSSSSFSSLLSLARRSNAQAPAAAAQQRPKSALSAAAGSGGGGGSGRSSPPPAPSAGAAARALATTSAGGSAAGAPVVIAPPAPAGLWAGVRRRSSSLNNLLTAAFSSSSGGASAGGGGRAPPALPRPPSSSGAAASSSSSSPSSSTSVASAGAVMTPMGGRSAVTAAAGLATALSAPLAGDACGVVAGGGGDEKQRVQPERAAAVGSVGL